MTAEGQDEPLLHVDVQAGAGTGAANPGGGFSWLTLLAFAFLMWLTLLAFAFLMFNSLMAIYRYEGDMVTAVSFVVCSNVDLARYERQEQGSGSRMTLQMAIWLAFSYKVASIMPVPVQVLMWGILCGFLYRRKRKRGMLGVLGGIANPAVRLIVDSGASMHAVGDPSLLSGLRYYPVPRPVTQPNGTDLNILGIGHIQLEDFWIPNVSLVLGLQKCLISTGQLDTDHGITTSMGRGIAQMMLSNGTIVGGAILDNEDNMYVLRFLDVREPAAQE